MGTTKNRRPVQVRRAHLPRDTKMKVAFALLRAGIYGIIGMAAEVLFYTMVRLGRKIPLLGKLLFSFDWRVDPKLELNHVWEAPVVAAFGQSSLWMFPVYAICAFFFLERWYRLLARWPLIARALVYGLTINAWEVISGWLLLWGTGYKIWYYDDAGNIFQMSSFFITPVWMATGLIVETVYRELMDPEVAKALEEGLTDGVTAPPPTSEKPPAAKDEAA
jgi:hypothetical protein